MIPRFINLGFPGFVARRWIWFHRVSNNSLVFFKQNIPSITRLEIWPKSLVWDKTDQFQNSVRVIESKLKRYLLDKTQELLNNWSDFDFVLIQPKERVIKFMLPLDLGYKGFGASFLISPRHAKQCMLPVINTFADQSSKRSIWWRCRLEQCADSTANFPRDFFIS